MLLVTILSKIEGFIKTVLYDKSIIDVFLQLVEIKELKYLHFYLRSIYQKPSTIKEF